MKEKKPGVLSEELKVALGMAEGFPPPWLINMQRFGPPPAYPNLRIPGEQPRPSASYVSCSSQPFSHLEGVADCLRIHGITCLHHHNLCDAGLNAPLPEGAQFGMHHGGWGKPPVNEYGHPLYGDVFGQLGLDNGVSGMEEVRPRHCL